MQKKNSIYALLFGLFLSLVIIEIAAQIFYFFVVKKQFDSVKDSAFFFLQKTENEILGYELKPNINVERDNKPLIINKNSVRERENNFKKNKKVIGLLGDSVVFGIEHGQDSTIAEKLQDLYKDSVEVINLGVPGYATHQMVIQTREKNKTYQFDEIIYLMNPNDFTLRNTVFEGADNGVYRYFNPPFFKSVWFMRKLIYRIKKKGELTFNTDFYKWCFEGTKDEIFNEIQNLQKQSKALNINLKIVVLPAGSAYGSGDYALKEMYREIENTLKTYQINYVSPINSFKENYKSLFDETDHLTSKGNDLMAKIMFEMK